MANVCPLGVVAGDPIRIKIDCPPGYTQSVAVSGPFTDFIIDPITGHITIPTQTPYGQDQDGNPIVQYGAVTVTVTCTPPPNSGLNPIVETCTTEVIDPDEYLDCEVSEPCYLSVQLCVKQCACTTTTLVVEDCEALCQTSAVTGVAVGEFEPEPETEPCPELEPVALVGTKQAWTDNQYPETLLPEWCEEDDLYCEPHKSIFIWNDLCQCPGWTVSGAGIEGTTAANACGCVGGSPWKFYGTGTATYSGGIPASADIAVIYGHNIASGIVTTNPAGFGGPTDVELCFDEACLCGFTRPIIVPFDGLSENITSGSIAIQGTTVDGGPICIDYMMMGQKFELPEESVRVGFQNPMNQCQNTFSVKRNECGDILQMNKQRTTVPFTITIDKAKELYVKRFWRSYLRWLGKGNPVMFQPSINRCEGDLFFGIKTAASSTYTGPLHQQLVLQAEGEIEQNQVKALA